MKERNRDVSHHLEIFILYFANNFASDLLVKESKHDNVSYTCEHCEFVAIGRVQLRNHIRTKHSVKVKASVNISELNTALRKVLEF